MAASTREWQKLGCAALAGAMIAFPVGLMVSGRQPMRQDVTYAEDHAAPTRQAQARQPYSADPLSDPYVRERYRDAANALEISCRQKGEACAEAEQARRYLDDRDANAR